MTVYSVIISFTVLWVLSLKCHLSIICKHPFHRLEKFYRTVTFLQVFQAASVLLVLMSPHNYVYFVLWVNSMYMQASQLTSVGLLLLLQFPETLQQNKLYPIELSMYRKQAAQVVLLLLDVSLCCQLGDSKCISSCWVCTDWTASDYL